MSATEKIGNQPETLQTTKYSFPIGTVIYPEYGHFGRIIDEVIATKLNNLAKHRVKIKNYLGWVSQNGFRIYFDRTTRSFPPGTYFGAPPSKGKLVKKS